jgi:hypothetical protein
VEDDADDAVTSEVRLDSDNDGEETVAVVTSPDDRETEKRESIPGKGARSSSRSPAVDAKDVVVTL